MHLFTAHTSISGNKSKSMKRRETQIREQANKTTAYSYPPTIGPFELSVSNSETFRVFLPEPMQLIDIVFQQSVGWTRGAGKTGQEHRLLGVRLRPALPCLALPCTAPAPLSSFVPRNLRSQMHCILQRFRPESRI